MSIVTIRNVEFLNNPARFLDPYHFRVTFECIAPLPEDLEWRLIYVASPGNEELDQELDDCLWACTRRKDVLGVAALILTGSIASTHTV
ncbi:Histone chaperone ASF1 [Grifola frondosa]|uniref:Anti-silencing function protein 1 n=1 Tax=Grifola frondosa TaxID=5627 RepID=A0A1C7MDY5_GRIFR|nr:Histone chaperone ASF1 [Grifola frondosa]